MFERPAFGALHEASAQALASSGFVHDQTPDLGERIRAEAQGAEDVDPADDPAVGVDGDEGLVLGALQDPGEPLPCLLDGGLVAQLAGEASDGVGVGRLDFSEILGHEVVV